MAQGIDPEATRIAEGVQHLSSSAATPDLASALALIQIEPRLLAVPQINSKAQPVLEDGDFPFQSVASQAAGNRGQSFAGAHVGI